MKCKIFVSHSAQEMEDQVNTFLSSLGCFSDIEKIKYNNTVIQNQDQLYVQHYVLIIYS